MTRAARIFLPQGHNFSSNRFIPFNVLGYFLNAVANRAVIPPAQKFTDID